MRTHKWKSDAAHAIGSLLLDRRKPYSYDRAKAELINQIHKIDRRNVSAEIEEAALKRLLEDPESNTALIMRFSRIRDLVSEQSAAEWQAQDRKRFQYLRPFGSVAANQLLKASRNASLQVRYNIAHLLSLLPPEIYNLLRATAGDHEANDDTRRASILAVGMIGDAEAGTVLVELLNDETYRGNAISALANIKTEESQDALRRLKRELETGPRRTFQQEVWLSQLETALENVE
jgi:HEAT repeat protein